MNRTFLATAAFAALATAVSGQGLPPAPYVPSGAPPSAAAPPAPQSAPQTSPPSSDTAPAASEAPVVHGQPADVAPDYVIGPGDSLEISVWKEPNVSGTIPVRPDGMISLPLVGDIQASGLTPVDLGKSLTERLRKYITDPAVTVTVLNVKSKYIYLLGEVGKPGEVPLTPGMTPLQAIATGGGVTQYTSGKHSYILRGSSGKQQKIPFNYNKAIRDGNLQGVTLQPGDTIVVK